MLSGIAIGIAQAMGMHSDSASSSLGVVDAETRRRVWWSLCQLDNRISEDCGLENHVPLTMDAKLPLHVNDQDLVATNDQQISPRSEFSETTVSLIKIEFARIILKFKKPRFGEPPLTGAEKEELAKGQIRRYEETYLTYFDGPSQLHRLCYLGTRLIIAKLWRMAYDATKQVETRPEELDEALVLYNADVLEIAHQLPDNYRQFGWFFHCKYTQWHAMAYLLIELCKHTQGPAVDRAWQVLDAVFSSSEHDTCMKESPAAVVGVQKEKKKSMLWLPLLRLLERARNIRRKALQSRQSVSVASSTLDSGYESKGATPVEDGLQTLPHQDALLGDPFLSTEPDFGEEMSWEHLETWVQSLQTDFLYEQDSMDYQTNNMTEALSWWS